MGFFARLLGKIFGRKPRRIELKTRDLRRFLDDERSKSAVLRKDVPEIFEGIRHHIKEISSMLNELDYEAKGVESERLKKVVQSSKKGFSERVARMLQELEPPQKLSAASVKSYCFKALDEINKGVFASRKNIAYASTVMPEEMLNIGRSLDALSKLLEELRKIIEENPIVFSDSIEEALSELEKIEAKISSCEDRLNELSRKKESAEEMLENARKKLSELRASEEAKRAEALEAKLDELIRKKELLRSKAISEIIALKRPLKKFEKACERGSCKISYDQSNALRKLMTQPEVLLKSDPKGASIKEILGLLKESIEKSNIELSEKEKMQALLQIEKVLAMDFFSDIFWPTNEADAEINSIKRELKNIAMSEKIHEAKLEASRLERELNEVLLEHERCSKELDSLKKELKESAEKLSGLLSDALGYDVVVS